MNLSNTSKYLSALYLISVILVMPGGIHSQQNERTGAKLEGIVLNSDKEPIPKAEIQLEHEESSQIFHAESNKKGSFPSGILSPGNYTFIVKKEGYKSYSDELQLLPSSIQKLEIILAKEDTLVQKREKEAASSFQKGTKFAEENKLDEAIQEFQRAIELKKDFAEAYVNLGILLFQQEKDDEAEKVLLKSLELKPEESKAKEILADINFEKAKTLIKDTKIDEALEKLKLAYSFRADHPYVNYLLGYLYFKKNMKDEAIKHLEKFLQLAPDSPQVEIVNELLKKLK